jgi:putative ABC transport system permease protein
VFDLDMAAGTIAGLTSDGILVDDDEADGRGIAVGDELQFAFVDGTVRSLHVQGIYRKDDLAGPFVVSNALHESTGVDQYDFAVYLQSSADSTPVAVEAAVRAVVDEFPNAEFQSRADYIDDQTAQVDMIVNLMYGLLALAIVIALFSIANSIALSVHERTREIGLLRAVGMTRHQIGSVVRWEVVIVSLLGTLLGVILGVCFGWALSVTLRNEGLADVVVPVSTLAVAAVAAVIGSVLAAVRPSWRAAHLDVLSAISSE